MNAKEETNFNANGVINLKDVQGITEIGIKEIDPAVAGEVIMLVVI